MRVKTFLLGLLLLLSLARPAWADSRVIQDCSEKSFRDAVDWANSHGAAGNPAVITWSVSCYGSGATNGDIALVGGTPRKEVNLYGQYIIIDGSSAPWPGVRIKQSSSDI